MKKIIEYSKQLTLLYVEDSKESRESTLLVFKIFFDNIIVATDGQDGLEKFKNNANIDIVISDINMPIMNGLEMSKEIVKIDPSIPILISSAYNEVSYFMEAIKIGVEGYLLKPLELDQFVKSLGKAIETIRLKKENYEYETSLEQKVQQQVEELREKDKLLIQSAKMAEMGDMIDIIAHQWKQPLNSIFMQADLLSLSVKDGTNISSNDLIECSHLVQNRVEHLIHTLNEFRGFFRPAQFVETVDLKDLFDGLRFLMQDMLIANQIELITDFKNIKFDANKNEFQHIFITLINNAKDSFVQNNIEDRKIIVQATESTTDIVITVKDNAGGIPDEIIDDIFKQNFTTKKDSGGTGIGLYICKTITQKYNVDIKVKSYDGNTLFTLTIPKRTL